VNSNVKFERRVNIRTRNSDRAIFWFAVAAALAAHILFWLAFNYRRIVKPGGESGSAVTMISLSDFPEAERRSVRNWMEYNDPRSAVREEYDDDLVGGTLPDRPPNLADRIPAEIPLPGASVGKFSEVPGRKLSAPAPLPVPPQDGPKPSSAAGGVYDGAGRALPLGDFELPPRTPTATGSTVLRVVRAGGISELLPERSCGDAKLDDFAAHKLVFLVRGETAPEFIVVEWPEARK